MKPSPLLLKAGLVVGLGGFALAQPSPAAVVRGCIFVMECPVDPEWVCNYYGCMSGNPHCGMVEAGGVPGNWTPAVFCEPDET